MHYRRRFRSEAPAAVHCIAVDISPIHQEDVRYYRLKEALRFVSAGEGAFHITEQF